MTTTTWKMMLLAVVLASAYGCKCMRDETWPPPGAAAPAPPPPPKQERLIVEVDGFAQLKRRPLAIVGEWTQTFQGPLLIVHEDGLVVKGDGERWKRTKVQQTPD